ncbi:unnamed protein product [Adineta ricciae]|uniref:G-protein coupled receptors family 1 profile domain-containing protein n=1 Tax=Adineta ricciae TaxID=249248 RepID=A0A815VKW3_ADIRI|nr:unnamed protein product [Adineta ricciae]CAF1533613.1 unnamed protein product [Adineta ricciae]
MANLNTTDMEVFVDQKFILHQVKFWLILVLQIPAILISLLIFVFLFTHRPVLRSPQNQILCILLTINLIQLAFDLPLPLHFYYHGYVSSASPRFCMFWTFFEFTLYATSEFLVATMSIQRHILIFSSHVLRIRWKHIVFYDLPILFCLVYPITFYACIIFFYPCDGRIPYDYTNNLCGFTDCYLMYDRFWGTYDWLVNNGSPMCIDSLANFFLIMRVVQQKHRRQQNVSWRQQRHMIRQLFCVSTLYIIGWGPCLVVGVYQIFVDPNFLSAVQSGYLLDLIYGICLFLPWMYLGVLPDFKKWILVLCRCGQRPNTVGTTVQRNRIETAL